MIRIATVEDFDPILDMIQEFWKHTQFTEEYDREHTRLAVEMSHEHGLLMVSEDEDGVHGFLAAIKTPSLCSPKAVMGTEIGWWINPEKRGRMAGVELIQFLERLCIEQEVKYINLGHMESSMPDKVAKLYLKMGYSLQETYYTKALKNGTTQHRS